MYQVFEEPRLYHKDVLVSYCCRDKSLQIYLNKKKEQNACFSSVLPTIFTNEIVISTSCQTR